MTGTPGGPAILAEGLRKSYGETRALDGLDLSVEEGTVLDLLGPNGADKTTAARVLATLLKPDAVRAMALLPGSTLSTISFVERSLK